MGYLEVYHADKKSVQYEPGILQDQDLVKSFGRELFKGGTECTDYKMVMDAINSPLTSASKIIYSPAFNTTDKSLSFTGDVLALSGRFNWLMQFNSSVMILLPEHIFEMGFQWKVLSEMESLRKLRLRIAYLNKNYTRESLIDIDQLFLLEDVTIRARDNQVLVERELIKINKLLDQEIIPAVKVGKHCTKHNKCDFFNYCWAKVPTGSIHNIPGLTSKQVRYLEDNEIDNVKDIPDDFKLSNRTLTEIRAVFRNKPILRRSKIQNWFNKIDSTGPISFLNIETIETAIPLYENCNPYKSLPYLYCLLYRSNSFMEFHKSSFMADVNIDPRIQFIENLILDVKSVGPIVTYKYNKTVAILNDISEVYPEFQRGIRELLNRLWDLGTPIKNGWYFHHSLNKSKELKTVLTALDDGKLYEKLKITDSEKAAGYYRLITALPIRREGQIVRALNDFSYTEALASFTVFEIFNSM